ncbi:MAG: phosphotransferase [Pyrinomonadaceae bacterium]|nr:phosphotransferase [Pyrinomonadaceae bacterium]
MSFEIPAIERLKQLLAKDAPTPEIERLTPDASTREFFRIPWNQATAIACAYSEPIDENLPQVDVTNLFLACGLPVARLYAVIGESGLVIHEDFGDRILRKELNNDNTDAYIDEAIRLIAEIQAGTARAYESGSIAGKLKFDLEKLSWELDFFRTHYFGSFKQQALPGESVLNEFEELSKEIEAYSSVLTHRDFHAANLMISGNSLKIIDHQDARIGPATYDLVSLLLDRIDAPPSEEFLNAKKDLLKSHLAVNGGNAINDIDLQFDLVTVQRCLKAIGTFSNQAANHGKDSYVRYMKPMFEAVANSCRKLGRFENIRAMVENELHE